MTEDRISEIRALASEWRNAGLTDEDAMRRVCAVVDREPEPATVRVFRYTKTNFKPVELLPVYRIYPDGCVTRQEHGDVERGAGDALGFLEHEVQHGRMSVTAEPISSVPSGGDRS